MKKRTVFIGNRHLVLQSLLKEPTFDLVKILITEGSFAENLLRAECIPHQTFGAEDKSEVMSYLRSIEFDILFTNGCPFLLPPDLLEKEKLYINIHPAPLPEVKGLHPINAICLYEHRVFGATTHFIDKGVDSGNIIAKVVYPLTSDIDLDLLYMCSFAAEKECFSIALTTLKSHDFQYKGNPQGKFGSEYKRRDSDRRIDLKQASKTEVMRKIKAFGIEKLGCFVDLDGEKYRFFEGHYVENEFIINLYFDAPAGTLLRKNDGKLLVKTIDGILRVSKYYQENS